MSAATLLSALLCGVAAFPEEPAPLKRTILQKANLPGDKTASILALVEILPNAVVPRHTHPGIETLYVLQGSMELTLDGHPTRTLTAGDSAMNPTGQAHGSKAGPNGVKLIVSYAVDNDQPLASPAK